MTNKSKYDIMKEEIDDAGLTAFSLAMDYLRISNEDQMTDEQMNIELGTMFEKVLVMLKKLNHITYENCKDVEKIDKQKILEYLEKEGVDPVQFDYNFNKKKKKTVQTLMTFAVMERDNIQFPSFKDPEILSKLLSSEGISELLEVVGKTTDAISNLLKDDFDLNDLSGNDIQLLEDYHNSYMEENIYLKVTEQQTKEDEIMKMIKSYSKITL